MDNQPVDQQALALTHAIALQESSGGSGKPNYNAVGDAGTSKGAYQWQPGNFESAAKNAGLDPSDFSPENQDKVAYSEIKAYKDKGYDPGQIASLWNSGSPNNWQNHSGTTTINGKQIHYDTPAYVKGVQKYYQQIGGGASQASPQAGSPSTPQEPGLISKLGNDVGGAIQGAAQAGTDTLSGKINPVSGLIQGAGALASGLTSSANDLATSIPVVGGIIKGGENLIGQGAQAVANTGPGKAVVNAASDFAQAHPEIAGDIKGVANIAGAVPIFSGLGLAKDAASAGLDAALTGSKDSIYEMVSPKLSAKETADAIAKRGTSQKGILNKTTLNQDKYTQQIAEAVKKNVPKVNPRSLTDSINAIQATSKQMGDSIRADLQREGAGMIYSPNELKGVLDKIEAPISLKGTPFAKQVVPLKQALLKIASEKGYTVPSLLDLRQEFDQLVEKSYPNLYDKENSPIRSVISAYRNALTDFTEKRVPTSNLKARLRTQSKLITAIENMSEKAASGQGKEIGGTSISRFAGRHPVMSGLLNRIGRGAIQGVGIGEGENILR